MTEQNGGSGPTNPSFEQIGMLYQRVYVNCYALLSRKGVKPPDIEDAIQTAFEKLLIDSIRDPDHLKEGADQQRSLMMKMTEHAYVDQLRHDTRSNRRVDLQVPLEGLPELIYPAGEEAFEDTVADRDLIERITENIDRIAKAIFLLRSQGCSSYEIGQALEITTRAVDTRAWRARRAVLKTHANPFS